MYFADNEPGVEPADLRDYALILVCVALVSGVGGALLTLAAWQLGWLTL